MLLPPSRSSCSFGVVSLVMAHAKNSIASSSISLSSRSSTCSCGIFPSASSEASFITPRDLNRFSARQSRGKRSLLKKSLVIDEVLSSEIR